MVATRQFGACFLVMLATGAILLATTQFLPQLVQQDLGYTATWAGLVLSPGGLVTMAMMFITGRLLTKIQPKYLIVAGASIIALSMYNLTSIYADVGFWYFAHSRMLLGVGLPLIFLSITAASYEGIPPGKVDQASALINMARNIGGSLGVALSSNVLAHREQFHQSRLVEQAVPSSTAYQETLRQMVDYFTQPRQLGAAGQEAGHRLDRPAGRDAGLIPGLHRRLLDADGDLARRAALALTLRKVKLAATRRPRTEGEGPGAPPTPYFVPSRHEQLQATRPHPRLRHRLHRGDADPRRPSPRRRNLTRCTVPTSSRPQRSKANDHRPGPQDSALQTPSAFSDNAVKDLAASLTALLADCFALYIKTKNFHWHMSGPHFRDYHLLLDEQADQIFAHDRSDRRAGPQDRRHDPALGRRRSPASSACSTTMPDFVPPGTMLAELRDDNRQTPSCARVHAFCDEHGDVATRPGRGLIDETNAGPGSCSRALVNRRTPRC